MRNFMTLVTAATMVTVSSFAFAEDMPASKVNMAQATPAAVTTTVVAPVTTPAFAPVAVTPVVVTPAPAVDITRSVVSTGPVSTELKDGTKVEIGADGAVTIIGADGSKVPAPDGTHTLKDGTTISVKSGTRVIE